MDEQLREKVVDWLIEKPKFMKYLGNHLILLALYAKYHPRENIIPDFELKREVIEIGGEKIFPDYDKKIFEFTIRMPGKYKGKKFGWREFYFGLNGPMLRLAKEKGFTFKIISRGETRYIEPELIKKTLENKWIIKWITSRSINLYGIPLSKTVASSLVEKQKIKKISNYF